MANVTADIRIFPNKEMFSVDMAEVLDAGILRSGVIQGCHISETNGVLNIDSGRIVIGGRLGVVTGGVIPLPSISVESSCTVLAVCDLRNNQQPFYVAMVDSAGLDALNSARTTDGTFNVVNGLDYVILGTVTANPATGLVSNWVPSESATAKKGKDLYSELTSNIKVLYVNRNVTLPTRIAENNPSVTTIDFNGDLPAGTKLAGFDITLGGLHMPYLTNDGFIGTWVGNMSKRSITVKNRSGAYNNYEMAAVLFYVTDPNPNS